MTDDWFEILLTLLESEVRFLVIGAHAMAVHGVPRGTQDLDVWVEPSPENAERVWRALAAFGAPLTTLGVSRGDLDHPGPVLQLGLPPNRIDILTEISGVSDFAAAWAARSVHEVRGRKVPFIGRAALIANKRATGRRKDITPSQWSPDRRLIAFEGFGAVWVVPAAGGESRRVTSGRNARWAPTSGALYYLDGPAGADALFRIAIDPETGAGRGKPRRLQSLPGAAGFDVRGQRLVYTIAKTTQQARAMTLGGQPRRIVDDRMLTEGTARVTGATISPDGESVAFSQVRGGEANLYVVPFNGGSPRRIETPSGMVRGPSWSPDGSRLAFTRVDSIGPSVMLTDLQTRALQRIGTLPGPSTWNGMHEVALWAANGKHLAYLGRGLHQMALVNIERQSERDILIPDSVGTGYQSVVPSPDAGTLVVSTLFRPADWGELWWVSAQGNKWRKVRGPFGESWPIAWQRDGWLYLANHRALSSNYFGTVFELWRMRGPEGTPEFVAPVPDGCNPPALSADGNRLVCVSERTESDLYLSTDFDPELQQ